MNIEIKTVVLGQVNTNCYFVWNTETKEGIIFGIYIGDGLPNQSNCFNGGL